MPESSQPDLFGDVAFLIRAYQLSQMLSVAAALGLADRIHDLPRRVDELAAECAAHPAMLLRMIRALAAFGIFSVDAGGAVRHTPHSRLLHRDAVPTLHHAARYRGLASNWAAWAKLEHTIRTGEPAFETAFGIANFEYLNQHAEEAELFNRFMEHSPDDRHSAVVKAYDFSTVGTILDVGGGNGAFLAAVLARNPDMRGVLLDQERALARAPEVLGPLTARCLIEPGNFFARVPEGRDMYVLSQILHDWSDERCAQILANCRAAMRPDSRLLVIERVLTEEGDPKNYLSDMEMMVLFPGAKERSLEEYLQLFAAAELAAGRLIRTRSAFSIIETSPS
jgi:hypothetical protein